VEVGLVVTQPTQEQVIVEGLAEVALGMALLGLQVLVVLAIHLLFLLLREIQEEMGGLLAQVLVLVVAAEPALLDQMVLVLVVAAEALERLRL
jgi:hypothetical protein